MPTFTRATDETQSDVMIIPLFEAAELAPAVKALDQLHGEKISAVHALEDFSGKKGETAVIYTDDEQTKRLFLIGLGKEEELTIRRWKQTVGQAIIAVQGRKWTNVSVFVPSQVQQAFDIAQLARTTVVAIETAAYAFDRHKSEADARVLPLAHVAMVYDGDESTAFDEGVKEGEEIASGVNLVRELGNTPPAEMTPTFLANTAEDIAASSEKMEAKILSRDDAKELGMGCFLGVAQGSSLEPKFIILEYSGAENKDEAPIVLAGKGITFDSGGLSIKPANYMSDMKFDMLGAATVLAILQVAAALDIKKNIVGLAPACENMPSGTAYRPDDILTNMDGKTVEVGNTDAEGRLILCDALSYAKRYKPAQVIDFATLTGACMVALGDQRSGLFTEEERMREQLLESAETVGEQLWPLPLGEEYSEAMKSDFADIKNIGQVGGRGFGGASTAAAFLQYFTNYPWAHVDLSAGFPGSKMNWIRAGATGFGVEFMIDYLRQ